MSSWLSEHRLVAFWVLFAAGNVVAMVVWGSGETLPFHFVWISFTLLYVTVSWSVRVTAIMFLAVCAATSVALTIDIADGEVPIAEAVEIPLMGLLFAVTARQVTQLQAAASKLRHVAVQELEAREREYESLRDVSHEMKNRLTVARAQVDLLDGDASPAKLASNAAQIVTELTGLARVTERLLELNRVTAPVPPRLDSVDVPELLAAASRRWSPVARRTWWVVIHSDVRIHADAEQLRCALDALLENALDFTGVDDRIGLMYRCSGGMAEIAVVDNGSGIDEEIRPLIFERFYSRRPPGTPRAGSGLGLAIASAVARAHGGTLDVDSVPGAGSTFVMRLPVSRSLAPEPALERTGRVPQHPLRVVPAPRSGN